MMTGNDDNNFNKVMKKLRCGDVGNIRGSM